MPIRPVIHFATILMALALPVDAQDSADAIGKSVETARTRFETRIQEARARFVDAMEKRGEKLANSSDLEDLKRFRADKEAFLANGTLPSNPFVALEKRNYQNELDQAKSELKKALESARAAYARAGKIGEAEAIDSELRAGASPVVERVEKQPIPLDPIVGFWRIVIGKRGEKQTILNVYFPPVDNPGVRSGMARRNQTSPVKYFQGSWSKSGDLYTLHGPNGATAKVKMGGGGEGFAGRLAAGAPVVGFRQQR